VTNRAWGGLPAGPGSKMARPGSNAIGSEAPRLRLTKRGRTIIVVALMVAAVSAVVIGLARRGDGLVRPGDPCAERPPMQTYEGVMLQPVAMRAFKDAQRAAGGRIDVVQSYRSCAEQAAACTGICGNAGGCPGRCVKPGTSYHQLGAAIDVTQGSLDASGVIAALTKAGWCESVPRTDPGHFSYGGCH
jgi:D-alanyl-D-alanine carboxypeptidase